MEFIIPIVLFLIALIPVVLAGTGVIKTPKGKKIALICNIVLVFGLVIIGTTVMFGQTVTAAESDTSAAEIVADVVANQSTITTGFGLGLLAAALSTGLSCVGAGTAVAASASAAIGAISENPKTFGKAIIFVALAEGVALYGMLISFQILSYLK
ncbi:MAG: hypothetical protein A2Y17_08910 [Clostridiales bacterium GWF2_38_85]|nr:MAG: hypothetical protein A2Y17_08910 [Clostridiales bacterium GWF2_38_85]HBL83684.1 ATPase [Clostridiales bacterium]